MTKPIPADRYASYAKLVKPGDEEKSIDEDQVNDDDQSLSLDGEEFMEEDQEQSIQEDGPIVISAEEEEVDLIPILVPEMPVPEPQIDEPLGGPPKKLKKRKDIPDDGLSGKFLIDSFRICENWN